MDKRVLIRPESGFLEMMKLKMLPQEIIHEIGKYNVLKPQHYHDVIKGADTYCLDKGRFCWFNYTKDSVQMQASFCLRCYNYILSNTTEISENAECNCENPIEDWRGNTMMWIQSIGN